MGAAAPDDFGEVLAGTAIPTPARIPKHTRRIAAGRHSRACHLAVKLKHASPPYGIFCFVPGYSSKYASNGKLVLPFAGKLEFYWKEVLQVLQMTQNTTGQDISNSLLRIANGQKLWKHYEGDDSKVKVNNIKCYNLYVAVSVFTTTDHPSDQREDLDVTGNSPDCPYHAVTTTIRKLVSSDEISRANLAKSSKAKENRSTSVQNNRILGLQAQNISLMQIRRSVDSWVTIHNLKLLSDGGILDPDDKLNDVADDREQITAVFDEEISSYLMHNGGDGTSASSVGTESPDIFQNGDAISIPLSKSSYDGSDAEIRDEKLISGLLPLHVRRGSEPALNRLSPSLLPTIDNCKRWSAAVLASDESYKRLNSEGEELSEDDLPPGEREDGSGEEKSISYHQYLDSWNHEIYYGSDQRKEPLGGPITSPKHSADEDSDCSNSSHSKVEVMKLKNEDGPLGIRIVPADESPDRNNGVIIQGIEPGGRIDRDGRFCVGDRITEINGLKLCKDSYRNAHEILKDAMKAPELSIHCIKKDSLQRKNYKSKQPPAVLPKPLIPLPIEDAKNDQNLDKNEKTKITSNSTLPLSTPIKRLLANALNKGSPGHSSIRKVGRRILVHLTKGSEGLGFSITSKDPNNGPPFFIKNILPAGAAVDDGRLKTGDKLLEVNKIDVSSLTQPEVLSILRKVPYGEMVELVISRQETDLSPSPSLPRQLPPEKCEEEVGIIPWKRRDIFTYEVPLNDTGSAGLGVSVKGKTSNTEKGPLDMGIFLKNIFHGGAAHKDGRLCVNDQLLNVNGISLLGMTNGQAMETLRRAMIQGEGPNVASNAIILTVARRVSSPNLDHPSDQGEGSGHDRSDSLLSESGDSFYVSTENLSFSNKCNGVTPDTSTSDNSANTVIFNASVHRENTIMEQESNKLFMTQSSEDISTTELINVQTSDTSDLDVNNKQYLQHSAQTRSEINQQKDVTDLIDFHESSSFVSNYEHKDQSRGTGSLLNHNKTFSNLTEMDLYQSDTAEQDKIQVVSDCDNLSSFREQTKRKRFPLDGSNNFKRSGLGRQSMPEKKFMWVNHRSQCLSSDINKQNGRNIHNTPHTSHELLPCQHYSEHLGVREMPVDVGPIETLTLKQRKHHRIKGSCNSPDCPYHAVPTTTGRESGSSDEISEQVGPSLGLFKSSSLESLQTMLHEKQKQNLPLLVTNGNTSRGCNESFRAAVDKSFEVADQNENSVINKNDQQQTASLKRHTRAKTVDNVEKKDSKHHKKKGLFRGLGSVFRFGKSSKKAKEANSTSCKQPESVDLQAQNTINADQERVQRQYEEHAEQQLLNQQLYNHSVNRQTSRLSFTFPRNRSVSQSPCQNGSIIPLQSREERMHALRNEHQKKHRQRNGYYPQEDREEIYEQRLKELVDTTMINRPLPPLPHQQTNAEKISQRNTELSPKSKNLEIYKEMSKPGSRKGFADPNRYSHYMNFQEIQQHLQQFRLHQNLFLNEGASENQAQHSLFLNESKYMVSPSKRHYRHTVSTPRSRPVSELYDFRNISMTNSSIRGMSESGSLPKRMFYNSRQRPPIPIEFMAQVNENNYIINGQLSSNLYNQIPRNSGSKV
ncbi:partitioning defective 3 homolog [Nephila pilipes]|uniref:Partitioning defective 3 homolog n=1 Tax=Nephila pilipes TaxID=299642 RepID=A0A8X6UUI4_NEPPI|nr:partitioning defective 3 homolog [Nephila pilipes]